MTDSCGDGRVNFVDVGGYQEGNTCWIGKIGTLGNAFGCWEDDAKGLGLIGWM